MKNKSLTRLIFAAVFAALIAVFTAYIKIPSTLTNGYTHFGDSLIYLAGCILPLPYAVGAAAVGGALADLLAGAPHWMLATAIIKIFNVLPFPLLYKTALVRRPSDCFSTATVVTSVLSGLVTFAGYFFATCLMYSPSTAMAELPMSWVQPTGSAIVFWILAIALDKVGFKRRITM